MALGYLSKALRRASPSLETAPLGIKPAARTRSPLAEEDQRLHNAPEVTAPAVHQGPLADLPALPASALPVQEPGLALATDPDKPENEPSHRPVIAPVIPNELDVSESPVLQPDPEGPATTAAVDAVASVATPDAVALQPAVVPAHPEPAIESGADRVSQQSEPVANSLPADPLSRALASAVKWVSDSPPDAEPIAADSSIDTMKRKPGPVNESVKPIHAKATAERESRAVVEPVVRAQSELRAHSPAARVPTVEIGSIEIEILPPPVAQAAKPAPRSAPVKTPLPRAAPFGWRQR